MDDKRKRIAERLKDYHDHNFTPGEYDKTIFGVAALLLEQNAADVVKRERGEWLDKYNGKYANASYFCSVCGKKAHSDEWRWILSDFCPNCGADMRPEGGAEG